jgi:L-ascorbate metabolism protein UlaG (beta-lactamase superfamily)
MFWSKACPVLLLGLVTVLAPFGARGVAGPQAIGPHEVKLTWVNIADWVFKVGDLRIYMDGAITKFDRSNIFGGVAGFAFSHHPVCPDLPTIQRVLDALGGEGTIDFILTGHSNLDHSFDTATIAKLTGAHIVGSQSTCFQAFAQGIPRSQCTIVNGGEVMDLGGGVTVHVVRWNHSGNASNPDLHEPRELTAIPTPDPVTGCLRPGTLEDFPNGGGGRGYLFTVNNPGGPISWFYVDTGSDFDFDQPVIVDGANFGSPRDGLITAMWEAGLSEVDLWIGLASTNFARLVVPLLNPRALIPNHLGSFFAPFFDGLTTPFSDLTLEAFLLGEGIQLVVPHQYLDAWKLDAKGIRSLPNTNVKRKLGF